MANFDVLVVSPHLDDAALSFGGSIADLAEQGKSVLVYTALAGIPQPPFSPAAKFFHNIWGFGDDAVSPRRKEDLAAMKVLGATPLHGNYLDGIYRRTDDGNWLIEGAATRSLRRDSEFSLIEAVSQTILELISAHSPTSVMTCSAIIGHVDHQRVRDAAIQAGAAAGLPVRLWEDLPYGIRSQNYLPLPAPYTRGNPIVNICGDASWTAKLEAVASYASQLSALGDGSAGIQDSLDHYGKSCASTADEGARGEKVWPVVHADQ